MNLIKVGAILTALSATISPAMAAVPPEVQAMIDAAITGGDDAEIATVIKFAKQLYPDDAPAIAEQQAQYKAAQEQARIDKMANASFFQNWRGEGQLGGFQSTGNTDNLGFTAGITLDKDSRKWRTKLAAALDYQTTDGIVTREQGRASLESNYKFDDRLFAYGLIQYERDPFQGFSSRYSASGGLGYRAIKTAKTTLDIKAGPNYRLTEFADGGSIDNLSLLAALDFDWQMTPQIKFLQDTSLVLDPNNTSLISTTAINTRLSGSLSAQLSYSVEYESNPPGLRQSTDTISRATLVYGF